MKFVHTCTACTRYGGILLREMTELHDTAVLTCYTQGSGQRAAGSGMGQPYAGVFVGTRSKSARSYHSAAAAA